MRIGNVILDTDNMTYEEVDILVKELRDIRKRKGEARDCKLRLNNAVIESREHGSSDFPQCSHKTCPTSFAITDVVA